LGIWTLFIQILSLPPFSFFLLSETLICILVYLILCLGSLRVYSFSFTLFPICSSDWIISLLSISLVPYSACSNLLSNLLFIPVLLFSSKRFWLLFIISTSLLISSVWWHVVPLFTVVLCLWFIVAVWLSLRQLI
jgi:hypothetical protein